MDNFDKMNSFESSQPMRDISWYEHEAITARQERHHIRTVRGLVAVIVALVLLLAGSLALNHINNKRWIDYLNEYDYSSEEVVTVDGNNGVANYVGNNGEIINGEDYSKAH